MSAIKQLRYFILLCLIVSFNCIKAQKTPYLERLVTLTANKQTVAELFKSISAQTSVVFSYSQPFNDKQQLSLVCKNKPLRLVIAEILKSSNCSYKIKDKYIIIKCNNKPSVPTSKIIGYIYSAYDSLIIPQASIYIKQDKHSAVTNNFGFFELIFSNNSTHISVSVAKEWYNDTTIIIHKNAKQEVAIYLYPKKIKKDVESQIPYVISKEVDTTHTALPDSQVVKNSEIETSFWKRLKNKNLNFRNISDTLFTKFSISALPYIGTNRLLSINTLNKYSFNVLAGYSKGIDIFELGGIVNIDNGNVKYVQIAGLMNIVSGNVTGVQLAGALNINSKQTKGVQISGIANINKSNINGVQLSGIYNQAKNTKGIQLSGIMNISDTVNGVQISGIVNKARYLKGVQFSFLNILDTSSGLPIGFFSYVKNGYHKLEIATDELKFATISFGTGIYKFHNIFIAGVNYSKPQLLTYGYGLGGVFSIHKKWNIAINVTAQQFQNTDYDLTMNNILSKLFVGIEYKIKPKIQIGLGPTFNDFSSAIDDVNYSTVLKTIPEYFFYNEDVGNRNTKMWLGAKLYLKIL